MHDIKWIREHAGEFDRGLARRGLPPEAEKLIALDERRRAIIRVSESWKARRNAASKEIGQARLKGDEAVAQKLMAEVAECKASISTLEAEERQVCKDLDDQLAQIPNVPLPAPEVPDGNDEHGNVEHHHFGTKRNYGFVPKQHFELGESLRQMDFETAAKLSGARFVVLKKAVARLERALGQFMLDLHANEHGYTEVNPPLLVREEIMYGTAQLPKFRDDQFETKILRDKIQPEPIVRPLEEFFLKSIELPSFKERFLQSSQRLGMQERYASDLLAFLNKSSEQLRVQSEAKKTMQMLRNAMVHSQDTSEVLFREYLLNLFSSQENFEKLWLIPTAEVPLTNLVRESTLDESALPMRLTALTPCFRAEAGAAGKDTRGMIRQHQFTKVELVSITPPEQSKDEHERMLACAEEVLRRLDLHYRVVTLCAGDMGFASEKTYDIEVWLPGQNLYREISSCSRCGAFQARRMKARYRAKGDRQPRHVNTLNGSGVAVGRALIAVMETYQQQGGSIAVPDVLQAYMGGMKTIEPCA